jgi:hypothetical protein
LVMLFEMALKARPYTCNAPAEFNSDVSRFPMRYPRTNFTRVPTLPAYQKTSDGLQWRTFSARSVASRGCAQQAGQALAKRRSTVGQSSYSHEIAPQRRQFPVKPQAVALQRQGWRCAAGALLLLFRLLHEIPLQFLHQSDRLFEPVHAAFEARHFRLWRSFNSQQNLPHPGHGFSRRPCRCEHYH